MTSKVRYRVLFNRVGRLDQNGTAAVVIEAYQNGLRRYFQTGVRPKPAEWDQRKNEVKANPSYNRLIRTRLSELETFEMGFPTQYQRPFLLKDFDLLPERQAAAVVPVRLTLTTFMIQQIERERSKIIRATYTRYVLVAKMLQEYNDSRPVEFNDMTYSFVEGYDHHLRTIKKYKQNTIFKQHQVINKYLVKAGLMGHTDNRKNPYHEFDFKKEPTERMVFYPSEIQRIEELTFSQANEHLAIYRDMFLLAYYTLLRISDVTEIRQRHLIEEDGKLELEMVAQKTGKMNRLPLHKLHRTPDAPSKPEQIIRRYARTDNKPLFDRSHPKINEYVKIVFQLAGINKAATFHTARHSGITYLVQHHLTLPVVQELAQHSDIKTTMIYVHISKKMKGDALDDVQWF